MLTIRWIFAALHLLALGIGLGAIWWRALSLRGVFDKEGCRVNFFASISIIQAVLIVAMVFAAAAMARGFGV